MPDTPTLTQLDNTLRMFITFTGAYHGKLPYLRMADMWLTFRHIPPDSGRYATGHRITAALRAIRIPRCKDGQHHDGRCSRGKLSVLGAKADMQNTHPHELYILYHLVQQYGDRHPSLFRSHRKWKKLLPTLGEIVGVECEEVCRELYVR